MRILRELAEAQLRLTRPGEHARLECGCKARADSLSPCAWHRRDVQREMLEACEAETPECQESCCDPA